MTSDTEIPIRSFCIVVYVCRVSEAGRTEVLLLKRASTYLQDTWQMVSGKIESGEKGWEAGLRELREETWIVPDRFYSADCVETFYEVRQNCINLCPVFVALVDGDTDVQLSDEHSDFVWVPCDEVARHVAFERQADHAMHIHRNFFEREPREFLRIPTAGVSG